MVEWLYERVLRRHAHEQEVELALAAFGLDAKQDQEQDQRCWRDLAHVLLMSNEFLFVD